MRPLVFPTLVVAAFLGSTFAPAQELAPLGAKPDRTVLHANHHGLQAIVKFVHDSGVQLQGAEFHSPFYGSELDSVRAAVATAGADSRRLIELPAEQLDAWRERAEDRSGLKLHNLNLFFLLEVDDSELLASLCDELNRSDLVEIAYPAGTISDPIAPGASALPEFHSTLSSQGGLPLIPAAGLGLIGGRRWSMPGGGFMPSPDFEGNQGYRQAAPLGIDADYGQWFSGSRGESVVIADVETGWTDDHEDIRHKALNQFIGLSGAPYPWDHGTAVLGELVGEDNGFGVKGIVHQSAVLMSSHLGSFANVPTAIANAANAVGPGDIVVLEVQCFSSVPSPHPCEYDPAIFATVQTATAGGTHVFAAAGNGSNNLDAAVYGGAFDRNFRDSGAVMVGASNGSSLNTASFSNYGTRCDSHGWGFNVATTGYGDLYNTGGVRFEYTNTFSGTSSATPIVTGAGVMVNGIIREAFGAGLDPLALRALLTATGTPQGSGGLIGPRPDVRAALQSQGVPTISVSGNLVPGGTALVTITGTPGDTFELGFSTDELATPQYLPPYGYRFLGTLRIQQAGVIGSSGSTTLSFPIPNNSGLSGQRVGFAQAAVTFASGSGTGTFTNYAPVDIQ